MCKARSACQRCGSGLRQGTLARTSRSHGGYQLLANPACAVLRMTVLTRGCMAACVRLVREAVASGSRTCTLTPYASPTRATGLRKERTVDTFAANDAVCGEKRASSVRRCVGGARRQVRAPTFRSPNRDLDVPSLWARQPRWLTADVVRPAGSGGLVTARAPAGDLTSMADGAASHVAPASRCSRLLE